MDTLLQIFAYFNEEWWYKVTQGSILRWKLWSQLVILMLLLFGFLAIFWLVDKTQSINTFTFTILLLGYIGTRKKPYKYVKQVLLSITGYWLLYWFIPRPMYQVLLMLLLGTIAYATFLGLRSVTQHVQWRRTGLSTPTITIYRIQIRKRN